MRLDDLVFVSYTMRWFVLVAAVIGLLVALLSLIGAHRTVRANVRDGDRRVLALSRRSSEALSVAAQLTFVLIGLSFVSFPPAPPSSPSQVGPYFDGVLRTGGFGFGAMVLALKSLLNLVTESDLGIQRLMRDAAHVADLEAINRRLEEATQAKSEFLANMSHELRTPLNAILGFSELLREQLVAALSDRQMRYLNNIRDAGNHLLELINDVLDISKVEAGRIDLRFDTIGLTKLTEPVLTNARQEADSRHVHFTSRLPTDARVRVDPARLRQVLFNLISNALKFTPAEGEVALVVATEGHDLLLSVRDTGIGIPADRHDRVFGTFERLNEDRSDAQGSGLGLALSKRLVELHGGAIYFQSAAGEGSTFHVRLPGVVLDALSGPRLLIVEDDPRDADLIVELARAAGLATELVGSAEAAIAALEQPLIGVVLDLRLPDMRGERVLERLRAGGVRRIPLVVVSVEDDDGLSRRLGADDHLTKPIDHARLAAWLTRVARRSSEDLHAPAAD